MDAALTLVILLTIVVAVSSLAKRIGVSAPLVLIVFGAGVSYVPFLPNFELTPELVLIGLLPPLLYSAAIGTSLVDFREHRRAIILLSVGLVIFTAFGIGLLMWVVLPISFAVALALGAVVAPPDAVAATSIARRVGLPRRVVTILEGESLVNDATAIVVVRAAIAGSVSVWQIGGGFVLSVLGGAAIGFVIAFIVGRLRNRIHDDLTDVAVSLLTPWVAYLLAEEIQIPGVEGNPSGVLAVVVAGLILGHKSPIIQSASSRMIERTNWAMISFVLENAVFLLIGMQVRSILNDLGKSELSSGLIIGSAVLALVGVIVLRIVWVIPATYLPRLLPGIARKEPRPPWQSVAIVSWAGMRGVVTLAAVFLLPTDTPHREVLVAIALFVTAGTLLAQGLTLPLLARLLKVQGPDRHGDDLQEAEVSQAVFNAGLAYLDEQPEGSISPSVRQRLNERLIDRTNAVWERLGGAETPSAQYTRARAGMLARERDEVLRIRALGTTDQTVLRRVLDALDVEESILDHVYEDETTADRETELRPVAAGDCEHLKSSVDLPKPRTPNGCEECLRDGTEWVHLRLCMDCGHVGCCDSSPEKHGTKHFEETGHPVMRSFEPGEAWRWCFVDELTG